MNDTGFRESRPVKSSRKVVHMFKDKEVDEPKWDRRFAVAKDKSHKRSPGKFIDRSKDDRPKDKLAALKAGRCGKFKITDLDVAKKIISSARWARAQAAADGRISKRREDRWFVCENCSGKAKIYHVTSLSEAEYSAKFEASKRGEFTLAA